MEGRRYFVAGLAWRFAAILLIVVALAACRKTAPEEALRQALADAQTAIESRDAGALSEHLAEDFIGPGGLDRDGARRLAAVHFLRHGEVGVLSGPPDIQLEGEHARVRLAVALSGRSGRLLPDSAEAWQVDTGWRLVDGDWRMTSADWSPALR
ncbi:nuclear transport factor 2 family protein [Luteimonas sp. MC1750]|uniref:nuclear transport factor 2 family protein n=1 Tax=Luteimonas sp. MC1750 TaxID=2799326 RepID=UPI0018F0F7AD|nr:nuclear transport factor 2 family protein [Luteimonas sp. MC1750]MBJ6984640.1 nuclear transport factor 2 family protein [Luteimonas sp. MC1750]QQO04758.1 nuclear transport factor 2 family protein [Luteimonas sp. MC1750]